MSPVRLIEPVCSSSIKTRPAPSNVPHNHGYGRDKKMRPGKQILIAFFLFSTICASEKSGHTPSYFCTALIIIISPDDREFDPAITGFVTLGTFIGHKRLIFTITKGCHTTQGDTFLGKKPCNGMRAAA